MSDNISRKEILQTLYENATGRVCVAEAIENAGFVMREAHPRRLRGATHFCAGTLGPKNNERGNPYRAGENIVETMVLPLDDVGTKAKVPALTPTMIVETKPGNYTYVYALSKPATPEQHRVIMASLIAEEYCDENCGDPERLFRMPGSQPYDKEHEAKLAAWNPEIKYNPDTFLEQMQVEEIAVDQINTAVERIPAPPGMTVEDEVLTWLEEQGMVRRQSNDGFYEIECPWRHEWHSEEKKQVAKYKPASEDDIKRVFYCFHTHGQMDGEWGCAHKTAQFLEWVADQGGPEADVMYPVKRDLQDVFEHIKNATSDVVWEQKTPVKANGDIYDIVAERMADIGPEALPQCKLTAKGALAAAQVASPRNVEWIINAMGGTKRLNLMTQNIEWLFDDKLGDIITDTSTAHGAIMQVASQCDIATSAAEKILENIPYEEYHPMNDWIETLEWDGVDYISQLASNLPVDAGYEEYTQVVIRKWLIQAVQAVRGWKGPEKQIPHVLVFCGPQGIGKTTWITNVAPSEFTKDGCVLHLSGSTTQNRDSLRAATQRAIVELGELETTFGKSEQGALKNFLSTTSDTYRPAYGKQEITVRRCTVFAASVNDTEILRDQSGARRYWPISLTGPMQPVENQEGIWAQANHLWETGESWFLTTEHERQMHDEITAKHTETPEVFDLMAEKYPNGFRIVERPNPVPEQCRILTITQIQKDIDVRGLLARQHIRQYIERNGGKWGRYTDANGNRVDRACVANPSDSKQMDALRRAMLNIVKN